MTAKCEIISSFILEHLNSFLSYDWLEAPYQRDSNLPPGTAAGEKRGGTTSGVSQNEINLSPAVVLQQIVYLGNSIAGVKSNTHCVCVCPNREVIHVPLLLNVMFYILKLSSLYFKVSTAELIQLPNSILLEYIR